MKFITNILRPLVHVLIKWIYRLYFNLKVTRNFTTQDGMQYIFCSNHSSHLDALALIYSSRIPINQFVVIAAKDYFFQSKIQQFLVQVLMDIVPIHRDPSFDQMRENVNMLNEQINQKKNLIIFPEGTRSVDGQLKTFKPGLGYTAKKLNLSIVPVYIHGTIEGLPKGAVVPKPCTIHVTIGETVPCNENWNSLKNQELSNLIYNRIMKMALSNRETNKISMIIPILSATDTQDDY